MLYAQGTVTGRGFLTHADRDNSINVEVWGNIIVFLDMEAHNETLTNEWLTRNSLTAISKAAAQALYDTQADAAIARFDPDDNFEGRPEPTRGTLP
jgi:hypothetical protein